jgi:thioredoxin 1
MWKSYPWKWPAIAAAGVLVCVAALAAYEVTFTPARTEAFITPSTLGERNMPITQAKSQVHHANEATFGNIVLKLNVPVLVDFYADWCGPCKRLAPILDELAAETPDAKIVKINVEDSPSLAAEYGVSSIPSLKVFRNGEVSDELVGLASKSQLRAMLDR